MILVTGGAGYLGCHVVSQLLDAGHAVRVIDAGWFGWDGLRRMVVDHPGPCELLTHDIRVLDDAVFEDVTAACHLAGLSNDPMAEFNAQANVSINRNATLALAAQAKRCVKLLAVIAGLLAATALHHHLTLVTRNIGDFETAQVPLFNPWEV